MYDEIDDLSDTVDLLKELADLTADNGDGEAYTVQTKVEPRDASTEILKKLENVPFGIAN